MEAVKRLESRGSVKPASWNAETLICELTPDLRDDVTEVQPMQTFGVHDETPIVHEPPPPVRGRLAELRPRVSLALGLADHLLRRAAQRPIVWAALVALFALGVHFASFHRASPAPLGVRVATPMPSQEAITDAAVQDLECLAIQAIRGEPPGRGGADLRGARRARARARGVREGSGDRRA